MRQVLLRITTLLYLFAGMWASASLAQMPPAEELPQAEYIAPTPAPIAQDAAQDSVADNTQAAPTLEDIIDQASSGELPTADPATTENSIAAPVAAEVGNTETENLADTTDGQLTDDPMEPQKFVTLGTLDKITGRTQRLQVPVGSTQAVGPLFLTVKTCQQASPFAPQPENAAFVQVWQASTTQAKESAKNQQTQWVFSGWMFSSSPALSALDHPVYDVWITGCSNQGSRQKSG